MTFEPAPVGPEPMVNAAFDPLTRAMTSRRTTLSGLLDGLATLLGLPGAPEAAVHDPAPGCKRIEDPKRRRACLRRVRAHNQNHRKPRKPPIVPQPVAETCAGRCGIRRNNCDQAVP